MNILVTGATGFIGKHLVSKLLEQNNTVTVTARSNNLIKNLPWYREVYFVPHDLVASPLGLSNKCGPFDCLIHLAWPGLPNYKDPFHLNVALPTQWSFLKNMVEMGTSRIVVTGTCFEYGLQEGRLSEDVVTLPENPYGQAKDRLRKSLEMFQKKTHFSLLWLRLFYIYGDGQSCKSLIAQLDQAIENGETVFNMSGGEQLRDYLPIEDVASIIATLSVRDECSGIYNCCRGEPISIKELVEQRLRDKNADIMLNLGYYDYPDYEPMAFWGDRSRLNNFLNEG